MGKIFKNIGDDKVYHFIAGALVTLITYLILIIFIKDINWWWLFITPIVAGVAKELWDVFKKHDGDFKWFDFYDIFYTIIGGAICAAALAIAFIQP